MDKLVISKEAPAITQHYRGRFAPSPTGDLHRGSLLAALVSKLDALRHDGAWLVRIEDLDPPREVDGASTRILHALDAYGFEWDGDIVCQSHRGDYYQYMLEQLKSQGAVYPCTCSRKEVSSIGRAGCDGVVYPGTCRKGVAVDRSAQAWRLIVPAGVVMYEDRLLGLQSQDVERMVGDFVLKRSDGYWAYQFAVVVDDIAQGISHIVRGSDLLDSTPRQIVLYRQLGQEIPGYFHLPVLVNQNGEKLSKQTLAKPLSLDRCDISVELCGALKLLGQTVPLGLENASVSEIWAWMRANFSWSMVPARYAVSELSVDN